MLIWVGLLVITVVILVIWLAAVNTSVNEAHRRIESLERKRSTGLNS
jgi:hypothetical protein